MTSPTVEYSGGYRDTSLGRIARVDRARGARGPLTLRLAGTPERWIERKQETTRGCPFLRVGVTDRGKTPVGFQKGNICPKWEVEASRCSIAGVRAHGGARVFESALGEEARKSQIVAQPIVRLRVLSSLTVAL